SPAVRNDPVDPLEQASAQQAGPTRTEASVITLGRSSNLVPRPAVMSARALRMRRTNSGHVPDGNRTSRKVGPTPGTCCEAPKFTGLRQLHPLVGRHRVTSVPALCRQPGDESPPLDA